MSTLKLYKHTGLELGKHFIIENMENYLEQFEVVSIANFQYIKIALLITIKVDMSQTFLAPRSSFDYDYLSIINPNESIQPWTHNIYYFYIVNKTWKSENTIELSLSLDTLNTYRWNTHYIVDKKTLVKREHKDRVKLLSGSSLEHPNFQRIVHLTSEGITAPLHKSKDDNIIDKVDTSWSLMYKNQNDIEPTEINQVNPVNCFLMPNNKQNVYYAQTNKVINPSDLPSDGTYPSPSGWLFNPNRPSNLGIQFKGSNGTIYRMAITGQHFEQYNFIGVVLQRQDATHIAMARIEYYLGIDDALHYRIKESVMNLTSVEVINTPNELEYLICNDRLPNTYRELYGIETGWNFGTIDWSSHQTTSYIDDSFIGNRTDSKIIKIINLPYCPTPYEITEISGEECMSFASIWEIQSVDKCLKMINDAPFSNIIKIEPNLNPFDVMVMDWTSEPENIPSPSDLRDDSYESKIYHSDFFQPKFVYDSFNLVFKCEQLDFDKYYESRDTTDEYLGLGFDMRFVMSRNIVSKFAFIFPQYFTKYSNQDYDNVVVVSRNNEEVLYTSQYINYLRTGYNYDLKSKARNEIGGGIGLGLSALSTIIGIVGGFGTKNPMLAIGSAVVGGISIANQSINYAKSVAQMEQSIEEKINQSKAQANSVLNADDLDLLNAYSNNRAKMCFYEVSPTMKQALLDMFYYSGYATQEQKVPNITTRYWFNFVQCDLVVNYTSNLPSPIMDDIKAKFSEGCTFFHEHNGEWDVEQTRENYESWILE